MAFAGLVMYFVEYLKKKAKYRGANVLLCVVKTCAMCILSYIEFLCKMSVLMTAITGNHFVGSGKKVVQLFTQSFGDMKASTGVWWIPAMIINVFVKICSLVFAFLVRQLRHHFGPFFAHFSAPPYPTHTACDNPLCAYTNRVLIDVWNPML